MSSTLFPSPPTTSSGLLVVLQAGGRMPWFPTIEASFVLDIHFGLFTFLPYVPFLKAIWARGVSLASNWALPFGSLASLWFLTRESALDEGAYFFIDRGATLY